MNVSRYKKTLMAKKAAALQSFQKCDVGNLAIPSTIVEDTENRNNNEVMEDLDNFRVSFDQEDCDTDKFVMVESEAERGRRQSERGRLEMELGRLNERERNGFSQKRGCKRKRKK